MTCAKDMRTAHSRILIPSEVRLIDKQEEQMNLTLIVFAELISLVKHMKAYPSDSLGDALRNVFDFDIYKPETIDKLSEILIHHGSVALLLLLLPR